MYKLSFLLVLTLPILSLSGGNEEGIKFLEENKKNSGVIELPSGLQYKVLKSGDGQHHPTIDSTCSCHYHGTHVNGEVFDSSVERGAPIDFAPNQVIKGWTEAMQMMVEGDKWELYIPSDLAYGDAGSPPKIKGGETLIFTIEMLEIKGNKIPALRCDPFSIEDENRGNCNERELSYIEKKREKGASEIKEEVERLEKLKSDRMKPELADWIKRRLNILKKLISKSEKEL